MSSKAPECALIQKCDWNGESYTALVVQKERKPFVGEGQELIGLRFLARHLVTFNFPKGMLYLKRTDWSPPAIRDLTSPNKITGPNAARVPRSVLTLGPHGAYGHMERMEIVVFSFVAAISGACFTSIGCRRARVQHRRPGWHLALLGLLVTVLLTILYVGRQTCFIQSDGMTTRVDFGHQLFLRQHRQRGSLSYHRWLLSIISEPSSEMKSLRPSKAPAPNRRPRFPLGVCDRFHYPFLCFTSPHGGGR